MELELNDVKALATKYMGSLEMGKAYLLGYIWASLSDDQKIKVFNSLNNSLEEKNR